MRKLIGRIDVLFNALVSSRLNPLYHSGVIALLALGIASVSGLYLFIFYRIGAEASYDSMEKLAQHPFYLGNLMRGLHRYSSDLTLVAAVVHALRLLLLGRFRGHRWLSWVSGIWWVFLVWVIGASGYWLVWDQRGQMVALSSARAIDTLVVNVEPFAHTFLHNSLVKDNLFFVLLFLHIALSLFMGLMWWLHNVRISRPRLFPPSWLCIALSIALGVVSLAKPAINTPRADLYTIPSSVPLDLFYLFFVPMVSWPAWVPLASGGTLLLLLTFFPWITRAPHKPPAEIVPEACTGCLNCFRDCPYEAISMRPAKDEKSPKLKPVVQGQRCASCGICVGACEFDAIAGGNVSPVEMEGRVTEYAGKLREESIPVLVFACQLWLALRLEISAEGDLRGFLGVKVIPVPCIGALPPALLSKALGMGFAGIFLASCPTEDCVYRQGSRLAGFRLKNQRPPHFHGDMDRVALEEYVPIEIPRFKKDLTNFRERVATMPSIKKQTKTNEASLHNIVVLSALSLAGFFLLSLPANSDWVPRFSSQGQLKFAVKELTPFEDPEIRLIPEELEKLPFHMRPRSRADIGGSRVPLSIELSIDGRMIINEVFQPGGLKKGGPINVYREIELDPGEYDLMLMIKNAGTGLEYLSLSSKLTIRKGEVRVVEMAGGKVNVR